MKTLKLTGFTLALALGLGLFASCSDDDSNSSEPLPPIGGYNNSGEVGSNDLIAYFPLDGNGTESKSSVGPSNTVGASWVDAVKGQGVNLTNGYLEYPAIASLPTNLNAFTISAWVKLKNNKTAVDGSGTVSAIFSMTRPAEWEGNINLYAETGHRRAVEEGGAVNDSIEFKGSWRTTADGGQSYNNIVHLEPWMVDENLVTPGTHVAGPNVVGGTWAQAVFTWDGATNKFIIYSNGAKISNPKFEIRGSNTSLTFDTPTHVMIGAFANRAPADLWNQPMTGQIDEIRVWKKALTAAEINSLYELEKAGR